MAETARIFADPVDWDQMYPGRFMKAGEFQGKKPTLTITAVKLDELEGTKGKQVKGILSFKETEKGLALNRTNGICIKAMFGKVLKEWIGKRVTLFAGTWNGEDCIRVWGSPDIPADFNAKVELPRKRPFDMMMHKVVKGGPQPVKPAKPTGAPALDLQAQLRQLHAAESIEALDAAWVSVTGEYGGAEIPLELEAACTERREALDVPY